VAQLEVGDLQLDALTPDAGMLLTPVELRRFSTANACQRLARSKAQRHERPAPGRLSPLLLSAPPLARERSNPAIGAGIALRRQSGMHLPQGAPLLARLPLVGAQPVGQLCCIRIELAGALPVRLPWRGHTARQVLGNGIA